MIGNDSIESFINKLIKIQSKPNEIDCLSCKLLHCDYYETRKNKKCVLEKDKHKNQYRKLQNYVYHNLKKFGNSIVTETLIEKIGKEGIIDDLTRNGFVDIYIDKNLIVSATYDKERDLYASSNS